MTRIVVAGALASAPGQGGAAWAVLQWVLGFDALGHDVLLVEPSDRAGVATWFREVVDSERPGRAAAVLHSDGSTAGLPAERVRQWMRSADVLVNLAGVLSDTRWLECCDHRIYVDLDPGFTQQWVASGGIDMGLQHHAALATVGLRVGSEGCGVPTLGRSWVTTLPPVTLDRWTVADREPHWGFTSVGNWRSYGSLQVGDTLLGQRAHSVRALATLPSRVPAVAVQPAWSIHPSEDPDLTMLGTHGWTVLDPACVASSTGAYRRFVRASAGEFGVAKSGYVVSRSGWFSDRTACYLASGRPAVVQDTGWSDLLPHGDGLVPFATTDDAAAALDEVSGDLPRHSRAARAFAEEHLDARVVLTRVLDLVMC